jgi:multidrug efflux pump subunit AcrA (membrane-fusion protein)
MKSDKFKLFGLLTLSAMAIFLVGVLASPQVDEAVAVTPSLEAKVENEVDETLLYPVSGVVEPVEYVVVKARQAGVVGGIAVAEGNSVVVGDLLAVLSNPVLEARLGQQAAGALVNELAQATKELEAKTAAEIAKIQAGQAITLENLTREAEATQLARLNDQVSIGLRSYVATLPGALRFVQDNKTLFTAKSIESYDRTLDTLYNQAPAYLKTTNTIKSKDENINTLAAVELLASATSTADLVSASEAALLSLRELNRVFAASESEFLDDDVVPTSDPRFEQFLENRQLVLNLERSLTEAVAGLESLNDSTITGDYVRGIAVQTAGVNEGAAVSAELLLEAITDGVRDLSAAERAVLLAELNESILRSTLSGVVTEVLVKKGEYVTPGTPLLRLANPAAVEVTVQVPALVGERVTSGSRVFQNGIVVGEVSRRSGVATLGRHTLYLEIEAGLIGAGWRGEIEVSPTNEYERVIDRSTLRFGSSGAFVLTPSGVKHQLEIIHDAGESLLVKFEVKPEEELVKSAGVRL